jgi:hypothetical protein
MIYAVDPRDYPNIVAHGDPALHDNLAYYATDDDSVLGVVIRDRIDNDFAWVVLGEDADEAPGLRAVDMGHSRPSVPMGVGRIMVDIFEFWSQIGRGEKIHPADRSAFARMDAKRHGFRLDCLPAAFGGRLRDAPVVMLYLSPGFTMMMLRSPKPMREKTTT